MSKRQCPNEVRQADTHKMCPFTSVILITGEPAKLRHQIFFEIEQCINIMSMIVGVWSIAPTNFSSPDPAFTPEDVETITRWTPEEEDSINMLPVANKPTPKVYYPAIDPTIANLDEVLPELFSSDGNFVIPKNDNDSDATFRESLERIHLMLRETRQTMENIYASARDLDEGKFPEEMFPINSWLFHWFDIPTEDAPEEQMKLFNSWLTP